MSEQKRCCRKFSLGNCVTLACLLGICLIVSLQLKAETEQELLLQLDTVSGKERIELLLKLSEFYMYKSPAKVIQFSGMALDAAVGTGVPAEMAARAELNLGIGYFQSGNLQKAGEHYAGALEKAKKIRSNAIAGACFNGIAAVLMKQGKTTAALENFLQSAKYLKLAGDLQKLAGIYSNISLIHYQSGNYHRALEYMYDALALYEKTDNLSGLGVVYNSMGNLYNRIGDSEKALVFFKKALKISKKTGNLQLKTGSLVNLGEIHRLKGELFPALEKYRSALAVAEELGNRDYIAVCSNNIGDVLRLQKNTEQALEYYRVSLAYFVSAGAKPRMAVSFLNMGRAYSDLGDSGKALEYLKKALAMSREIRAGDHTARALKALAKEYEKRGDLNESLRYLKSYTDMQDKFQSSDSIRKIADLQSRIQSERQARELAVLENRQKIRDLTIKRQKLLNLFVIFGLIMVFIIALVLYKRFRLKVRSNLELSEAYARMERLAKFDSLTHLYNRRSMLERIEIEMVRMGRTWRPFCLVMVDVDDFKQINDAHGHECGDRVLTALADVLKEKMRQQDVASRWGGEEFLLMLPETGMDGGVVLADKLRETIENIHISYKDVLLRFTVTMGINVYNKPGPLKNCIRGADMAMYEGKRRGKNILVRANELKGNNHSGLF